MNAIQTTHNLDYEQAGNWDFDADYSHFRVGTVQGLFAFRKDSIEILGLINSQEGNGHVKDVFEWFEYSCKVNKKRHLVIQECINPRFKEMCIKNGYERVRGTNDLQKRIA